MQWKPWFRVGVETEESPPTQQASLLFLVDSNVLIFHPNKQEQEEDGEEDEIKKREICSFICGSRFQKLQ